MTNQPRFLDLSNTVSQPVVISLDEPRSTETRKLAQEIHQSPEEGDDEEENRRASTKPENDFESIVLELSSG
ncbi:Hypothetical protein PP7435_CHR3-0880 [Komagataella phaffii CBS 7435]|uniref:Uncharacterized protein n=1 Tax=Komagataella phaffii (strain ATCC 76273 / CBS 7435 / CECT 11047 / NRRL Y-11430 / Wegner 21-1) TaxID=981350 RepID=F2QWQ4_KOMPC|nr:Hypothetical protein BQ9382_C3-4655 [Komagataella phaffii CBS 7435]CCA39832.1 Hypothetical protein PP7435_CHR3-0880 [Komagataella phaffii CBS 7435]